MYSVQCIIIDSVVSWREIGCGDIMCVVHMYVYVYFNSFISVYVCIYILYMYM